MPLQRRLPKRDFTHIFKKRYAVVNLGDLAGFKAEEAVTPELLLERGLIKRLDDGLKILGEGELKARTWVRGSDGKVLKQEAFEKGDTITIDRED